MPVSPPSIVALGFLGLALALLLRGHLRREGDKPPLLDVILLFEGDELIDATGLAAVDPLLLDTARQGREATIALLRRRFADLGPALDRQESVTDTLSAHADGVQLVLEHWADFARFTLSATSEAGTLHRIASLEGELRVLRSIAEDAPAPIWREDAQHRVTWANHAYLDLADRGVAPDAGAQWPLQPIFPLQSDMGSTVPLTLPDTDERLWFDITRITRGDESMGFAIDASRIITAEATRKEFVQTLARTFADLRTGLVIFDRARQLVLFNPAFPDLTGLPPEFLARKPHIRTLLDRLRDAGILPEPRDWSRWRDRIASLTARAEQGSYCENWSLPDGRVFRVTGRPHPDGALAFLIEDATDDISLSRQLRIGQDALMGVIDRLPQAIAVFATSGSMILCNHAYAALWGIEADRLLDRPFGQELLRWRQLAPDARVWDRVGDGSEPVEEVLDLADGRLVQLRLLPLGKGRVMAEFTIMEEQETEPAARIAIGG